MGVAPEAISGCLQPVIDSNISFGKLLFFIIYQLLLLSLYISSISITFDRILKARNFVGPLVCKGPLRLTYK
jgi:hypothetical protein